MKIYLLIGIVGVMAPHAAAGAEPRIGLQAGFLGWGSGEATLETQCEGDAVSGCADDDDYDITDESGPALLVSVLFGERTKLGFDATLTVGGSLEDEDGDDLDYGTDLQIRGVIERGLASAPAAVEPFVGAAAGGLLLFPDKDLEDVVDSLKAKCSTVRDNGGSCSVSEGPMFGFTAGAYAGVDIELAPGADLRLSLDVRYLWVRLLDFDAQVAGVGSEESQVTYTGSRAWLLAGVIF